MYAELGACMRSWVHVYKMVGCMYAELGACMRSWGHVCGIGGMYAALGACMRSWVHVCEVGCMSIKRLGACTSVRPSVRPSVRCPPSAPRPPAPAFPPVGLVWLGSPPPLLCCCLPRFALLCSCRGPSLPFLFPACLLVPRDNAPPWAIYTVTLSRLFSSWFRYV